MLECVQSERCRCAVLLWRQVLQLRFGLEGEERQTLAEIGRRLDVSRERVRQVELKALRKLRNLTRRTPTTL